MASRVWSKFTAKKCDGSTVKLRIQDMPPERFGDVINLVHSSNIKHFFNRLAGIANNPEALAELEQVARELMKGPSSVMVICCEDHGDTIGEIIAASVNGISKLQEKVQDFKYPYKTKEVEKLFNMFIKLSNLYDVLGANKVNQYFDDRGLAVHQDYLAFGIFKELFNVRRKLCKEHNIPLVGGWMLDEDVQEAATADGWETAYEVSREEAASKLGVKVGEGPATWKFMIGKPL